MMKKIISLLGIFAMVISLFACAPDKSKYGYAEIRLDLPESFGEYDSDGVYDASYTNGKIVVGILRMSFEACAENGVSTNMSPRVFSEYYKKQALTGIEVSETVVDGDVVYYTYEVISILGEGYTYLATFFFTPYAYFVITYAMPTEEFSRNGFGEALEYAHTTRIDLKGAS